MRTAVVYATFVVALVFLPVLTMSGVQGKLFAPLGIAYILATLASLGVAVTVTPAAGCRQTGPKSGAQAGSASFAEKPSNPPRLGERAEGRNDWQSHPKSMPLGNVAALTARLTG